MTTKKTPTQIQFRTQSINYNGIPNQKQKKTQSKRRQGEKTQKQNTEATIKRKRRRNENGRHRSKYINNYINVKDL